MHAWGENCLSRQASTAFPLESIPGNLFILNRIDYFWIYRISSHWGKTTGLALRVSFLFDMKTNHVTVKIQAIWVSTWGGG